MLVVLCVAAGVSCLPATTAGPPGWSELTSFFTPVKKTQNDGTCTCSTGRTGVDCSLVRIPPAPGSPDRASLRACAQAPVFLVLGMSSTLAHPPTFSLRSTAPNHAGPRGLVAAEKTRRHVWVRVPHLGSHGGRRSGCGRRARPEEGRRRVRDGVRRQWKRRGGGDFIHRRRGGGHPRMGRHRTHAPSGGGPATRYASRRHLVWNWHFIVSRAMQQEPPWR